MKSTLVFLKAWLRSWVFALVHESRPKCEHIASEAYELFCRSAIEAGETKIHYGHILLATSQTKEFKEHFGQEISSGKIKNTISMAKYKSRPAYDPAMVYSICARRLMRIAIYKAYSENRSEITILDLCYALTRPWRKKSKFILQSLQLANVKKKKGCRNE